MHVTNSMYNTYYYYGMLFKILYYNSRSSEVMFKCIPLEEKDRFTKQICDELGDNSEYMMDYVLESK